MNTFLVGLLCLLLGSFLTYRFGLASKGVDRRQAFRDLIDDFLTDWETARAPHTLGSNIGDNLRQILAEARKVRDVIPVWKRWLFNRAVARLRDIEQVYAKHHQIEDLEALRRSPKAFYSPERQRLLATKLLRWCAK